MVDPVITKDLEATVAAGPKMQVNGQGRGDEEHADPLARGEGQTQDGGFSPGVPS